VREPRIAAWTKPKESKEVRRGRSEEGKRVGKIDMF
jgi:hypothetical protein